MAGTVAAVEKMYYLVGYYTRFARTGTGYDKLCAVEIFYGSALGFVELIEIIFGYHQRNWLTCSR